jgi:hypothetical protein
MKGDKRKLLKVIGIEIIFVFIAVFITKVIFYFIANDTLKVFVLVIFCIIINIFHELKKYFSIKTFLKKKFGKEE